MVGTVITEPPQPRHVTDDDTLFAGQLPWEQPSPLDDVVDADRLVVNRGNNEAADFKDPAHFLRAGAYGRGSGLFIASTLFTGSRPPPNRPILRAVMAILPWVM